MVINEFWLWYLAGLLLLPMSFMANSVWYQHTLTWKDFWITALLWVVPVVNLLAAWLCIVSFFVSVYKRVSNGNSLTTFN